MVAAVEAEHRPSSRVEQRPQPVLGTVSTIGAAQQARLASYPGQLIAPSPAREATLESFRQRNAFLDALFYDVGILSPDEARSLAPRYAAEGMILAVGPTADPILEVFDNTKDYLEAGYDIRALAIAGVGSSALGSAAFARNVANAINAPVIAVVSGYGLSDLLTEALGGFFLFGQLNSHRHMFEALDTFIRPGASTSAVKLESVRRSLDVRTLIALLTSEYPINLMVGHSKGNLVLSEALFALAEDHPVRVDQRAAECTIVTISAKIAMPKAFINVVDVIGQIDGFGLLNSRPSIKADIVVGKAWHHTNTELPFHLPVTRVLRGISKPFLSESRGKVEQ